jgi:hypothetical protein
MINFITNRLLKLVHFFSKIMIKTKILILHTKF